MPAISIEEVWILRALDNLGALGGLGDPGPGNTTDSQTGQTNDYHTS